MGRGWCVRQEVAHSGREWHARAWGSVIRQVVVPLGKGWCAQAGSGTLGQGVAFLTFKLPGGR